MPNSGMRKALLAASVALAATSAANAPNMNGAYVLSPTPKGSTDKFPRSFSEYPRGAEYVDIYSPPITSLYSQVFWKRTDDVPLPNDLVERFRGKGMAVVGFEVDQVRKTPTGDISVPINVAYNHHFESTLLGEHARMMKVPHSDLRAQAMPHGHGSPDPDGVWIVEDLNPDSPLPNSQDFGAANGGEFRKSFHGFAPGFAKTVLSPRAFSITPMQIDTWNRDKMNITGGPFVPGPVPRNSLAPQSGPDAIYSGLLECPVTTRIRKEVAGVYSMSVAAPCGMPITTASDCFAAVGNLSFVGKGEPARKFQHKEVDDPTQPPGCFAILATVSAGDQAVFNSHKGQTSAMCGQGAQILDGSSKSLVAVAVRLNASAQTATLTLEGPSDRWYGVGFNASRMGDNPWAITVDGNGEVTERQLADQGGGSTLTPLPSSVSVLSKTVESGVRTVVLRRPFQGRDARYYTFDPTQTRIPFINALGSGVEVAYHQAKTSAVLPVLPIGAPICVCTSTPPAFGSAQGSLLYEPTGESVGFNNHCAPQPRSDLLAQQNPTCDVRTYVGGQIACKHMWSLLDADQDIPWPDQPLVYHLKFRLWFQEHDPSYHQMVYRTTWGIASPVEYDVPRCAQGTRARDCVHTITGTWDVKEEKGKSVHLVAAHFHCHAPTCLSVELYNNGTGELLCREASIYGGGKDPKFDEPGFFAVPPCIWGDVAQGLEPPPIVSGQRLHARKRANSTYGHHGEMAWLQALYILRPHDDTESAPGAQLGLREALWV